VKKQQYSPNKRSNRPEKPVDMPSLEKIIFLDIDGVILPFPQNESNKPEVGFLFPKANIQALKRLLQVTDAKLVLSSTWRAQPAFVRDIIQDFENHSFPITEFYDLTDPDFHSERQWEIHKWIVQHQKKTKDICWLALDDEELLLGEDNANLSLIFQGRVIKTESSIGLTESDVDLGIQLWKAQIATLLDS
jgi:hypothetical protein